MKVENSRKKKKLKVHQYSKIFDKTLRIFQEFWATCNIHIAKN